MLFSDKADPGSIPLAGVWNQSDSIGQKAPEVAEVQSASSQEVAHDEESPLHGGTVLVKMGKTSMRSSKMRKPARTVAIGLAGGD
jgi:hypothetical protein